MAQGDQADFERRLREVLPTEWFSGSAPLRDGVLASAAATLAWLFAQNSYVRLQTRLQTATDVFLDGQAQDYLGAFPRRLNEPDPPYSLRVRKEIIRLRNTRAAIVQVLQDLTGNTPTIIQPDNPSDCGGWDTGYFAWDEAGCWGDLNLPFQGFVSIVRGTASGAGVVVTFDYPAGGWDAIGGWDTGSSAWVDDTPAQGGVTDSDIYAAVASVMPLGHIFWTKITGTPALPGLFVLDAGLLDLDYLM